MLQTAQMHQLLLSRQVAAALSLQPAAPQPQVRGLGMGGVVHRAARLQVQGWGSIWGCLLRKMTPLYSGPAEGLILIRSPTNVCWAKEWLNE